MGERAVRQITWAITKRCFLACRHCLVEASPNGASVSRSDASRIIEHLPLDGVYSLEITGGDPFSDYPLLVWILERLGGKKDARRVTVHTTGQWADGEAKTRKMLEQLRELGIDGIDFLCDDEFHWEAGLVRRNYESAVEVAREVFGAEGAFIRVPDPSDGIVPAGRGADVALEGHWGKGGCLVRGADPDVSMQMHITHNGDAFVCTNEIAPPLGNFIEMRYEELVDVARRDKLHRALMASGPMGVVRAEKLDEGPWSASIDEIGECRTCAKLLRCLEEGTQL